ncbi:MAG: hypothetical protein WBB82_06475 [Limnothrix sp.]
MSEAIVEEVESIIAPFGIFKIFYTPVVIAELVKEKEKVHNSTDFSVGPLIIVTRRSLNQERKPDQYYP